MKHEIIADFRSDTVTRPSASMMEAMMQAAVGDDVFGDDPTVIALETKAKELFGMEAALFCASGTMTNQLAMRVHLQPGSEVICDKLSHIYLYEGGGIGVNALSSIRLLDGDYGRINALQVEDAINNPQDVHLPVTRLVSLENTMNKGGGTIYDMQSIQSIKKVCVTHGLALHLDGARLFNAIVETGQSPFSFGAEFDTISICLSKGLGCPVGSILLGSKDHILKARRYRKLMGGGWRQAGFLAAAGIYALDHNVQRLKDDHKKASYIGSLLEKKDFVKYVYPIATNIVIFELNEGITSIEFCQKAKEKNIFCVPFGKKQVRFVTHLDIDDQKIQILEEGLAHL